MSADSSGKHINRRQFLASAASVGACRGLDPVLFAALNVGGTELLGDRRLVFESSFEAGHPMLDAREHTVAEGVARTGTRSMVGEVAGPGQACMLEIPFSSKRGRTLHISFYVRSNKRSACAVFVRVGNKRASLGRRVDHIPVRTWKKVRARYHVERDTTGVVQIVAPSSFSAPAGKAWIDDVQVYETEDVRSWPENVQDFPALAADRANNIWLATVERPGRRCLVRLDRIRGEGRNLACSFEPDGATGIGAPAITALNEGCVVAFAVEQNHRWRIAYQFVHGREPGGKAECRYIDAVGPVNISGAVAALGERACCVWESNAGGNRAIYGCWLDRSGAGSIRRISDAEANSYNPAIVTLTDGSLFAAWDSIRGANADIYGAYCRNGRWEDERRITRDARIERHPALAVWKDEVWMAWQAQSYRNMRINNLDEQRVVVARVDGDNLHMPRGFFEAVSLRSRLLVRPRIAFDGDGRLFLTARQSIARNDGWNAMLWCCSGSRWAGPWIVNNQKGRWRPASLVVSGRRNVTASQYDDLPPTWAEQGIHPDWKSGVSIENVEIESDAAEPETVPLAMPPTDFSLAEKMALCSADLPRQRREHDGRLLTLYWGDFHDHTDISVCVRDKNPPGHDLFANERDIERLDFCALTDHGYNYDPPQWAYNSEQTRNNHDPGRFVTFLGEEWTSSRNPPAPGGTMNRYGHRNLIFKDPYHPRFYDSYDGDISPGDLWKELDGSDFICIPHQLADWKGKGKWNPPTDWDFADERLQPVAEIFQARQSYEYLGCPRQSRDGAPFRGNYLQDAWARGIVIGVIASPDHGGGTGKVGVWAAQLTREAIFEAVRARHTFGTSGAKMGLLVRSGDAMMGDKVRRRPGRIPFEIEAVAMRPIGELLVWRNNEIVHRIEPNSKQVKLEWVDARPLDTDFAWYYVRIHTEDDELAWSSPMWFIA